MIDRDKDRDKIQGVVKHSPTTNDTGVVCYVYPNGIEAVEIVVPVKMFSEAVGLSRGDCFFLKVDECSGEVIVTARDVEPYEFIEFDEWINSL